MSDFNAAWSRFVRSRLQERQTLSAVRFCEHVQAAAETHGIESARHIQAAVAFLVPLTLASTALAALDHSERA